VYLYAWKILLSIISILLSVTITIAKESPCVQEASQNYRLANRLFNLANPTDETDSKALLLYQSVIDKLQTDNCKKEVLLFHAYIKKGILLDVQAKHTEAKNAYVNAAKFNYLNQSVNDSLVFRCFVYAGSAYYHLNNFDSARFFLRKAEALIESAITGEDKARLYNALGALYYDNGNYNQGKNYFRQALAIVTSRTSYDTVLAVNINTNIATAFFKMGDYHSALSIYNSILKHQVSANYIYMNMGRANAGLKKYTQALQCFRRVSAWKLPGVYNEIAAVQLELKRPDSATYFLDLLQSWIQTRDIPLNDLDIAINQLYRAEMLVQQKRYHAALTSLQKAIILFSSNFKNPDIYSNPASFTGTFAYYRLFDALSKKAMIFELLYKAYRQERYLSASSEAYELTLDLLDYVEKNYDTDDAKLLLKKRSRQIYEAALSVCIELNRLHPGGPYLEKAYLISERNKGSVVASHIREEMIGRMNIGQSAPIDRARNLKYNIARLNIKQDLSQDIKEIELIAQEKEGYEIELSRLYKQLEQNNKYYKLKYDDSYPGVQELQSHLTRDQAIINFYSAAENLHAFVITRNRLQHLLIDSLGPLEQDIMAWLKLLRNTESGRRFKGNAVGSKLYKRLIRPIQALISGKKEWIIIPDGKLYFLPFESLPDEGSSTHLVETNIISYQLSSRFITGTGTKKASGKYSVLSFAPFSSRSPEPAVRTGMVTWNRLPASWEEIKDLEGSRYLDETATKDKFLKDINMYPVVHLATHAVANVQNAAGSFIAFYPRNGSVYEDRLYLEELYGLKMDVTKLVIISACETGDGELVNNEGVISLARGFAYAGCESSVNSLWKADDAATSEILKKFHFYLQKGYTKSKALQKAKVDYIHMNGSSKSPGYWSNLILIGDCSPICEDAISSTWLLIIPVILLAILAVLKRIKKSRRNHEL
jgi:CHAT domain-containing protein